jgi:TonB family protein
MANYTILLIDYEPRSIERFREPLIAAGYKIEIATDGVSGIEAFHRLNPDMVLVEAMIPKKHGFEVCQELKRTPHGRRTPVLITTGVYKGRKYRTQALHIYGCDEYIEKPIAPEQLLKIVGKFFGSATSAPAPKAAEPAMDPPGANTEPHASLKRGPVPTGGSSAEPAPVESPRTKLTSVPQPTVVEDGAEDEIIARLDAILPGDGGAVAMSAERETLAAVAQTDDDPFAQMRAELNAELGSLSAALAFEPTLAPSDQAASPSVLDALPAPETEIPILPSVPSVPAPPLAADERPGQVVDFVAKRSRKNRKPERKGVADRPSKPSRIPPAAEPVELTLPPGTMVASELDPTAARSGMPTWIWAALGIVAIATIYFVFPRDGSGGGDVASGLPTPAKSVAIGPTNTNVPPASAPPPAANTSPSANTSPTSNPPIEAAAAVPEPPPSVPDGSRPIQNAPAIATTKKAPERTTKAPAAAVPTPKAAVAPPAVVAAGKHEPSRADRKIDAAKPTSPEVTAPSSLDDAAEGVEAVADLSAPTPTTTIAPGTLISIDSADTIPVALSHRVPVFSLQARQMRLSGTVVMNVLVNERGTVDQVVLVNGVSGAGVNDAAMRAAESWTYRPATKNGVPVKVWKSEQIDFKL